MTLGEIIVRLIIGALVGSLVGRIVKRKKEGFGHLANLAIGLVGAFLGGWLFDVLKIDLGLGDLKITFEDLLAAFIGALVFLGILALIQKLRERKQAATRRT